MIKVTPIEVQKIEHFDNNGKSIGFLNEYESIDLRCQISEQKIEGYYLMFNNQKIEITSKGNISNWIRGLYDTTERLLCRLFKSHRK